MSFAPTHEVRFNTSLEKVEVKGDPLDGGYYATWMIEDQRPRGDTKGMGPNLEPKDTGHTGFDDLLWVWRVQLSLGWSLQENFGSIDRLRSDMRA